MVGIDVDESGVYAREGGGPPGGGNYSRRAANHRTFAATSRCDHLLSTYIAYPGVGEKSATELTLFGYPL